ncbi:hypothetical protein AYL99_12095 [Fonsecaea erecta]|uniref:Uncharacterized protein n=1 Tax=Fonsecaea erecta TaxID=1367422 RepID=A0A178Z3D6_9EURO|nr:hypothetical protein AYL99_12095 [Fonsecaea erecta]OAP53723.1 hypothetical protein AYL99_12095 [Fonsecaea erecta]
MSPPDHITLLNPKDLFDSAPSFSHVAVASPGVSMIYCAGQVGADINREPAATFEEQARLAFNNVKSCLREAGATPKDVVKLTYYVVNWSPERAPLFRKALLEFLTDENGYVHRMATTLVSVAGLADPRWQVEIDAVAAIKAKL